MKRSVEEALLDLRQQLAGWTSGGSKSSVYVFVYPPEWEALMLARLPDFAQDCAAHGWPLELVDVGQGFLADLQRRKGMVERLLSREGEGEELLLHDLGTLAERYLSRVLAENPEPPPVARLLMNTGSLGTFVSYSAIINGLQLERPNASGGVPKVLAFPGEGDERSLNLLRLRADTNYRVPRI